MAVKMTAPARSPAKVTAAMTAEKKVVKTVSLVKGQGFRHWVTAMVKLGEKMAPERSPEKKTATEKSPENEMGWRRVVTWLEMEILWVKGRGLEQWIVR